MAPTPPSLASPHEGQAGDGTGTDRMIRLGTAFDPAMLDGDVDSLSPAGVEQQIRALMEQRGKLVKKRLELSHRQRALERRAVDAD